MHHPQVYCWLGLTRKNRKLKFRERILRKAEAYSKKGIESRIGFLKKVLCKQDTLQAKERRVDPPDFYEEDVISLPYDIRSFFLRSEFLDRLMVFNNANAATGLQALPRHRDKEELECYVVLPCEVDLIGDLRVAVVSEELMQFLALDDTAIYFDGIHQIARIGGSGRSISFDNALAHEIEHALHHTLLDFAGFPPILDSRVYAEYLSMLVELRDFGIPDLMLFDFGDDTRYLYDQATKMFKRALRGRYGLTGSEVFHGLEALEAYSKGGEVGPEHDRFAKRIKYLAAREYQRTYEKLFGLPVDDIKDVVHSLPML